MKINFAQKNIHKIYFIGISGVGMSAIAGILKKIGYSIAGSDLSIDTEYTQLLIQENIQIHFQDNIQNIVDFNPDLVVYTSAVNELNPEYVYCQENKISLIQRGKMLAYIMNEFKGIAVSGAHGKTTISGMLSYILSQSLNPQSFLIGGIEKNMKVNFAYHQSEYLIAEADESDNSFTYLKPFISVVNNIDEDHMETYDYQYSLLEKSYLEFIHNTHLQGKVYVCLDDENIRNIIHKIPRTLVSYGIDELADFQASNIELNANGSIFKLKIKQQKQTVEFKLNIPGKFNIYNALAVIAIGYDLGMPLEQIAQSLKEFNGMKRRFDKTQLKIESQELLLIDDYAHHPKEIEATLLAVSKITKPEEILVIFQPHRYSRTQKLWNEFIDVFHQCKKVMIMDIHSASEQPIANITAKNLAQEIKKKYNQVSVLHIENYQNNKKELIQKLKQVKVIVTLGAGKNIADMAQKLQLEFCEIK